MLSKLSLKLSSLIMLVLVLCLGAVSLIYIANNKDMYIERELDKMAVAYEELSAINFEKDEDKLDMFMEENDHQTYYMVIFDEDLKTIYSSSRIARARAFIKNKDIFFNQFSAGSEPQYINGNGYEYLSLKRTAEQNGKVYYINIEESLKISDSIFSYTNRNLLVFTIIFVFFSGIAMFTLVSNTIRPIRKLSDIASNITEDNYSKRYEGKITNDEIGILVKQINNMADTIQTNFNNLSNFNFLLKADVARMNEYEKMRKKVITNITHELKTPLAIISSQLEMMKFSKDESRKKYYYDSALEEINKMSKLISTLLSFSAGERELFKSEAKEVDLSEMIGDLCAKSRPLVSYNGIALKTDIEPRCNLRFAPENIEHVFNNYLMNAIQHTEKGHSIKISLKKIEDNYRLTVFNEGKLIEEDSLDKIWTDFYSNFEDKKVLDSRVGIGLFIVKEIAIINKTQCGVKNIKNGVEFWFDFCTQEG